MIDTCAGLHTSLMQADCLQQVRNKQAVYDESWCILGKNMLGAAERPCSIHFQETSAITAPQSTSYLAGHWRFSKHFAEILEGIERLLACCWGCNDLWKVWKVTWCYKIRGDLTAEPCLWLSGWMHGQELSIMAPMPARYCADSGPKWHYVFRIFGFIIVQWEEVEMCHLS